MPRGLTLQMGLQIIKLVLLPGRSGRCPGAVSQRFSSCLVVEEGGFILKEICLFLLSFSEKQLGKHTANTAKNFTAINAFLIASQIVYFPSRI